MFYLPDYERYATDCVDEPADFDIEQIARDLRDALDGADPETMDSDEFWDIILRNQIKSVRLKGQEMFDHLIADYKREGETCQVKRSENGWYYIYGGELDGMGFKFYEDAAEELGREGYKLACAYKQPSWRIGKGC